MKNPEGYDFKSVRTADIPEFPTALGQGCCILGEYGLDAYSDTEEDLLQALTESAGDNGALDICKNCSRCGGFWQVYQTGRTPFNEKDPIRLNEYNGKYWVSEGKHRVCMAKRLGVERIDAYVYRLDHDDYSLLEPLGVPGRYSVGYTHIQAGCISHKTNGSVALLWANTPRECHPTGFEHYPRVLDESMDTKGRWTELFSGLLYRVTVETRNIALLRKATYVTAEIEILPEHKNTRIWLTSALVKHSSPHQLSRPLLLSNMKTLYRTGCWRRYHEPSMTTRCI